MTEIVDRPVTAFGTPTVVEPEQLSFAEFDAIVRTLRAEDYDGVTRRLFTDTDAARERARLAGKPSRAVMGVRISDADDDETDGVDDQFRDILRWAWRAGWNIAEVIVENNTSAFKRRKVIMPDGTRAYRPNRPKYWATLDKLRKAERDGFIGVDLDRSFRDPKDLEDAIDVAAESHFAVPFMSLTGSLKITCEDDFPMARIMLAVANKSSADTARRVRRARRRQAEAGRFGGGGRRYGFGVVVGQNEDGEDIVDHHLVVEHEAAEIRAWAKALLAGKSLRWLIRDLNERGVPSVSGSPWGSRSVKQILTRPGIAGLSVSRGEILEGVTMPWEPIIDRETWEALNAMLSDTSRRKAQGNKPRWELSGIAKCGHPNCVDADGRAVKPMRASGSKGRGYTSYRCQEFGHCLIHAEALQREVSSTIIARLSRPDAAQLVKPIESVDVSKLIDEGAALRVQLDDAKGLWEDRVITGAELRSISARITERLAEIDAAVEASGAADPIADMISADDVEAHWNGLDLGTRRAIIDQLVTVTVYPSARRGGRLPGGQYFDPDRVAIEWKAD